MSTPTAENRPTLWSTDVALPEHPPLSEPARTDVCVVGAGIAGLTIADRLAAEGRRVIVIDAAGAGAGQSGRTSAHLSAILDDRFAALARARSADVARIAYESHRAAISLIEDIVRRESIDCDFERVDGWLGAAADGDEGRRQIEEEFEAARQAGVPVERQRGVPWNPGAAVHALRFPDQAQFHPTRYLAGLARAAERKGVKIYGTTPATAVRGGRDAHVATAQGHRIDADAVVVATNNPINDRVVIHTKQAPYTTYVIALQVPTKSVPRVLFWDTADPYHYVRVQPMADGSERLIVGGEDHKTGQESDKESCWSRLEAWARMQFPAAGALTHRWSGQVMETLDGLGFIGRNPMDDDNVYVVTGDSGMGLTHGTLAGILIPDLIAQRPSPWEAAYAPNRRPARTLRTFLQENLNVAAQLAQWLKPETRRHVEQIARGEGAVLQQGVAKVAVYRDTEGELHVRSAVCPHLGCVVRWNRPERIWDCPCHGSRFDREGRVITGPSTADLHEVDLQQPSA